MQFLPNSLVRCLDVVFQERRQASFACNMPQIYAMPRNDYQCCVLLSRRTALLSYVFNNDTTKAVGHEYNRILTFSEIFDSDS